MLRLNVRSGGFLDKIQYPIMDQKAFSACEE